jgi:hypothetical protein
MPCTDAARADAELTRAGTELMVALIVSTLLIVSLAPATACRARRESPAHRGRRRFQVSQMISRGGTLNPDP